MTGFLELIKNGIIHRDLKPEKNIIHDSTFILANFGFAKSVDNFKKVLLTFQIGKSL